MPITVDKDSEFFITIAKEGIHSFIMLGVMVDDKPQLLARVGKGNLIDPSFGTSCGKQFTMFGKAVGTHTEASLMDEGLSDNENVTSDISYQSYSITYEQYLEFLALTKEIHNEQLEHYKNRELPNVKYRELTYPQKGVHKLRSGINCYLPTQEESGKITFEYKSINTFQPQHVNDNQPLHQEIISGAKEIKASNTCRTTARALLNYTLHYPPDVPALFAIGLDYKTKLVGGKPTANTFYVLPQPPNCFEVNPTQMKVLQELYKKLENLPKNQPQADATRDKFKELKHLYQEIAGKPQLPLTLLLDKITVHRVAHNKLFDTRRSQSIISKFAELLGIKTGTQQAYDRMEKAVKQEIERVNKAETKKGKGADKDGFQSDEHRPPHATTIYHKN
ncbi:hypothetical protein [Legionella cincinnatiensis]|uniref:Uncharacterized protein n=1 Tax=Legionella cincinnatiensis TaxID=28085 RepID=A0A378IMT3_9GAMM|nr:hypothetical protein [Legionella cincinnatiensis]KTC85295.1 hypothetical protein Lcin_1795 [Legionella cincinnatiensis]STX36343.1 Uncharacterised protein [Legionella cincinnatiensis]